jgi:hypothetical protein
MKKTETIWFYTHGINKNKAFNNKKKVESPKKEKPKEEVNLIPCDNPKANAILGQALVKAIKEMFPL